MEQFVLRMPRFRSLQLSGLALMPAPDEMTE